MITSATPKHNVLSLSIKDKNTLYVDYMPFIINGGLFIPTKHKYKMGEEILILLDLMEETEQLSIAGKIIWETPERAVGYRVTGVGVQFDDQDNGATRNKIETYLAGILQSEQSTRTM